MEAREEPAHGRGHTALPSQRQHRSREWFPGARRPAVPSSPPFSPKSVMGPSSLKVISRRRRSLQSAYARQAFCTALPQPASSFIAFRRSGPFATWSVPPSRSYTVRTAWRLSRTMSSSSHPGPGSPPRPDPDRHSLSYSKKNACLHRNASWYVPPLLAQAPCSSRHLRHGAYLPHTRSTA